MVARSGRVVARSGQVVGWSREAVGWSGGREAVRGSRSGRGEHLTPEHLDSVEWSKGLRVARMPYTIGAAGRDTQRNFVSF